MVLFAVIRFRFRVPGGEVTIPKFTPDQIEQIARCLADARTHATYTDLFERLNIAAPGQGPKWFRVREGLTARQARDGVGNNVGAFIEEVMTPVAFTGRADEYEETRTRLNAILAFAGLSVDKAGKLNAIKTSHTLDEAESAANELREKLLARNVHAQVLIYCRPELTDGNYFHAVLEAAKGVAERIRQTTGLTTDGADLVDRAFCGKAPLLAINTLQTDTEKSEQTGFANLLKGLFGTFRNPTAHAPKVKWPVSVQDALDLMSLVSYVHRRLDGTARTHHRTPTSR